MAEPTLDPAVMANIQAGLKDAESEAQLQQAKQRAQQQLDFAFEEAKRKQTLESRNIIARGKVSAERRRAAEKQQQEQQKAQAQQKPASAPLDGLEQAPRTDSGGADPIELGTQQLGQAGGPQGVQTARGGGEEAPAFTVSGQTSTQTGPQRFSRGLTAPGTTSRTTVGVEQNALTPAQALLHQREQGRVQREELDAVVSREGDTIGSLLVTDPGAARARLAQIAQQAGGQVAGLVLADATKKQQQFRLDQKKAELAGGRIEDRQRASDARVTARQLAAEGRAQGRADAKPETQARRLEAQILLGISEGRQPTPDQRNFLAERQRLDPITRAVQSALEGRSPAGVGKVATQADVDATEELFKAEFGRAPSDPELRSFMEQRNFSFGE